MKTTEQGRKMIEEADKRGDKYFEMLGEKVAEGERGVKRSKIEEHKCGDEAPQRATGDRKGQPASSSAAAASGTDQGRDNMDCTSSRKT